MFLATGDKTGGGKTGPKKVVVKTTKEPLTKTLDPATTLSVDPVKSVKASRKVTALPDSTGDAAPSDTAQDAGKTAKASTSAVRGAGKVNASSSVKARRPSLKSSIPSKSESKSESKSRKKKGEDEPNHFLQALVLGGASVTLGCLGFGDRHISFYALIITPCIIGGWIVSRLVRRRFKKFDGTKLAKKETKAASANTKTPEESAAAPATKVEEKVEKKKTAVVASARKKR
eukprot:gene31275-6419_t